MSRASKVTFGLTSLVAGGIVYSVHWAQEAEHAAMRAAVERDIKNQQVKRERQADFEMQKRLEEDYKKVQTVSDGTAPVKISQEEGVTSTT